MVTINGTALYIVATVFTYTFKLDDNLFIILHIEICLCIFYS